MKNIIYVFQHDLKKIRTNVIAIVVLIGLTVIPSLYAWFNILSNWDPYGQASTSRIKVAVATDDNGTNIDGVNLNISTNIIESLKGNDTIGWVFPDSSEDAIEGVYSGDYYAALVIPDNFSSNMVSFLTSDLSHPEILYYTNQKKNAIAPKITDKAKTAVKEQVNATFISTIASTLVDTGITVKDSEQLRKLGVDENSSIIDIFSAKLTYANNELSTYDTLLTSLISITDITTNITVLAQSTSPDLSSSLNTQVAELTTLQAIVNGNQISSLEGLSSSLSENLSSIQNIMSSISALYSDMNGDVNSFNTAISSSRDSLIQTQGLIKDLREKIDNAIDAIDSLKDSGDYGLISNILNSNPEDLGEFVASPVNINTEKVYEVDSYGSAASPFYTVLSIWVGGLIMVAILHAKVKKDDDTPEDLKGYQKFFGRYAIFYIIGQFQTLLIVLGNMFYIKIQCIHPVLFWLACSVASFVFTLFMYSLTVAFENIGEALAIIIMVIQVAGSGGTFPIEVLPHVYQVIYKYLPFPYAMDALRETIGGMYGLYYWKCLGILLIYVIISLIIGLVLYKPFVKMNEKIEHSKEKSGVML